LVNRLALDAKRDSVTPPNSPKIVPVPRVSPFADGAGAGHLIIH
jgi:hypothetical protein